MGFRIGFLWDGGEAKSLVPLKLLFLIHYCAFSTQTYLPLYFDTNGHYSKIQIGFLLALPCICAIISPPIWGAVADVLQNQKLVHVFCLVTAALLMFCIQFVTAFEIMAVMVFIANFQTQPTWSLLDQTAMQMLSHIGGVYGKQRLYGAVGYGWGGYMAGVLAASVGIAWCFNMVLALSVFSLLLLVRFIPSVERAGSQGGGGNDYLKSLARMREQSDVVVLFIVVLLAGMMGGLIDSFLFLYYFNMSGNNVNLVGIIIAIETISELPLFFYSNQILDRVGTPRVVMLCLLAYGVRMFVYMYATNPWYLLPFEALHGLTFGLLWAAFTNYIYMSSAEGTQGTMIGMLTAVQKGMGAAFATLTGGYIYQIYGARTMWAIAAYGIFPLSMIFAFLFAGLSHHYVSQGPMRHVVSSHSIIMLESTSPSAAKIHETTPLKTGNLKDLEAGS
jgi:MFS family permease